MKYRMIIAAVVFLAPALSSAGVHEPRRGTIHHFPDPIDALSVRIFGSADGLAVRGFDGKTWTEWQDLRMENEQDPTLQESNLVIFPRNVSTIETSGRIDDDALHPIRIAQDPVRWNVAATDGTVRPRVLSRDEWGADESLLFIRKDSAHSDAPAETKDSNGDTNGGGTVSQRVLDCEEAQRNFPNEFKIDRTVTEDPQGRHYRWPLSYSKNVRLLVVHHTALTVAGDERSGVERVRALYQYHADNRGWGDVGYHYLIDESGQIYEGKAGGPRVVGGHAYCNNTGTVGVALLGNFEVEKPTQEQMRGLQWLLTDLADRYDIALDRDVRFHGKVMQPVVGHRDLLSTDCPGYYVYETLGQVRTHVKTGDLLASIRFPDPPKKLPQKKYVSRTALRRAKRLAHLPSRSTLRVRALIEAAKKKNPRSSAAQTPPARIRLPVPQKIKGSRTPAAIDNPMIRILLTYNDATARLETPDGPVLLSSMNDQCASDSGASGVVRIDPGDGIITIASWSRLTNRFRGIIECRVIDGALTLINELPLETYLAGLAEESDTEPFEKQKAFAIAARTYAAYYLNPAHRKFPGKPWDGSDSPATFQSYGGAVFEAKNPGWTRAVRETAGRVLMKGSDIIRAPYFSSDDGRTRTPAEAGWNNFPFAEIFTSKEDPWCVGMENRGHGVGMSGCGAEGQANEGKSAEEILRYYYPKTSIAPVSKT